jgi:hypothetical protein
MLSVCSAPVGGSPLGGKLGPLSVTAMQHVDPAAANIFFDKFGAALENQSSGDRVTSLFGVAFTRCPAAGLIHPGVLILVPVTSVVRAESVVRYIFKKDTVSYVQADAVPVVGKRGHESIKESVNPNELPRRRCIDIRTNR